MAIFVNNQPVQDANNVGQFGATDGSIGAYKQAAEYARDAEYWANIAKQGINGLDAIVKHVEDLYAQGAIQQSEIAQLRIDFANQNSTLNTQIAKVIQSTNNADTKVNQMDSKLRDVDARLQKLSNLTIDVKELPSTGTAYGTFDNTTAHFEFGIPKGDPGTNGKDGSVTDLNNTTTGIPVADDIGFYVDHTNNTVHRAKMSDIAQTFPSVTSIQVGTGQPEQGSVKVTKDKLGLGNVRDVATYSQTESDARSHAFVKAYRSDKPNATAAENLALAKADVANRTKNELVMVWNDATFDFYKVEEDTSIVTKPLKLSDTPVFTEKRVRSVNFKDPDADGNVETIPPTGNPSLYLGEILMFPYDPAKPVSYQGLHPADGTLVTGAAVAPLVAQLVSSQLPVVSETEWQGGKKQYFSWGKLADGTTDADHTNAISIRVPDWTDGTAIRTPEYDPATSTGETSYTGKELVQKPYVVTVNNVAPNDATGNVQLSPSSIGAMASDAVIPLTQGGTGATSPEAAKANLRLATFLSLDASSGQTPQSLIYTPNNQNALTVQDDGVRFVKVSDGSVIPSPIKFGGTGSTTAAGVRTNLALDRLDQSIATETRLYSGDKKTRVTVQDIGTWGVYDETSAEWKPLKVDQGGTGAKDVPTARTNLLVDRLTQGVSETFISSQSGQYASTVLNSGEWGGYDQTAKTWKPLGIAQGGTGAADPWNATHALKTISEKTDRFQPGDNPLDIYWKNSTGFLAGQYEDSLVGPWMDITSFDNAARMQLIGFYGNNSGANGFAYKVWQPNTQTWFPMRIVRDNGNTTIDVNGFIKNASPIVDIFSDGTFKVNHEAEGVSVERVDVGQYLVTGCLGTHRDKGWGGVDGGFEIPLDRNKQPRIWLDYEVNADGSILVKTYHRTHPESPVFARNEIKGVNNGDPIDIPKDVFISVRVEMPTK